MSTIDKSSGHTSAELRAGKRYMWEFALGIAVYLALFLLLPVVFHTKPGSLEAIVVGLSPLVPVLWMVIAMARHMRRVDEMQRLLLLQSFTGGFAVAMVVALGITLLGTAGVDTPQPGLIIFVAGMSGWALFLAAISVRRNR